METHTKGQLEKIAPLDLEILALMGDDEKVTEDNMAREIDQSSGLALDIEYKLAAIEEMLTAPQVLNRKSKKAIEEREQIQ